MTRTSISAARERAAAIGRIAVRQWGETAQRAQLVEELGELIVALSHHARGRPANVAEELGDVLTCLEQVIPLHGVEGVALSMHAKLDRLASRLQLDEEPRADDALAAAIARAEKAERARCLWFIERADDPEDAIEAIQKGTPIPDDGDDCAPAPREG